MSVLFARLLVRRDWFLFRRSRLRMDSSKAVCASLCLSSSLQFRYCLFRAYTDALPLLFTCYHSPRCCSIFRVQFSTSQWNIPTAPRSLDPRVHVSVFILSSLLPCLKLLIKVGSRVYRIIDAITKVNHVATDMPVAKTDRKKRSRSFRSDENLWSTLLHQVENGTAPVIYTPAGTLHEDER